MTQLEDKKVLFLNARSLIYRYVLSELTDEECHEVEERIATDSDFRQWVQAAEHELIAAYIAGYLTADKRERLEKRLLGYSENIEKLKLAKLLYEARANMPGCPDSSKLVFRYFLNEVTDEERREVEARLDSDENFKQEAQAAEHELMVLYTLEESRGNKRKSAQPYLFSSAEKIKKLKFAEDVYQYYQSIEPVEDQKGASARRSDWLRQWLAGPISISVSRPIWQPLAILVIGLVVLVWALFFRQSAITRSLDILHGAYAQKRPVEGRLTGFGYGEYHDRQNAEVVKFYNDERDEAFRLILREVNEKKSAAALHALGLIYLAYNDPNEAVHRLELALQQAPDDARLHNNLAVALMEKERARAENTDQSTGEHTALALEHLHRAIKLAPSLSDAHFNLALCHQRQMLLRTAEEDWKRYLEKDSVSPWAEEAKRNLTKVTEKIKQASGNRENVYQDFLNAYRGRDVDQAWGAYKGSRVGAGNFITDRLIDNYISLALSGESSQAEDNLSALVFIGNIELEKVQDRFTYDLSRFYRGASLQQLRKLSAARDLTKAATERLMRSQLDEAINNYRQAIELYDQSGDVCESLVAKRMLGHCYFRQASPALSLPVLTRGRQECEARGYIWPLSLFFNELANINMYLARYSKALEYGQSQMSYAKRVEDDYGVLRAINRVTETYVFLARRQETLQMVQEGLSIADSIKADPKQLTALYLFASKCHEASGKLLAALDYEQEAFKLSLEIDNPWLVSRHYVHLGLAHHRLNRHSEAVNLIRQGGEIGARLPDEKIGMEIMAFSYLHLGEVYRETGDINNAIKSYGDALRLCDENAIDIQWLRFWSKKGLLLTHIKRGDDAAVDEELKQVMDMYEQHRQKINDETSRNRFFDNEQGIYDTAVEYMYANRQDPRRAFDLFEKSRARSLLDAVDLPARKFPEGDLSGIRLPRSIQPLNLGQIQSRLPAKTQILQYSALNKRLIIWVVSGADFNSHSVEIGKEALSGKVTAYLESLEAELRTGGSGHKARSAELYDLLIKPVERWLDKDAEICVIPDKALNLLPFTSLFSTGAGKYLVEEHVILTSPSANMFVIASDRARQKESLQTERLLSVGNPQFDRQAFRDLKDLPWASTQASEISAFYPNSIVLLDRYAREPEVKKQIEKSDIVHIAAHYIADEQTPMLSALPLAAEKNSVSKENDGVLHNYELYKINLGRPRGVILSACKTVGEQNFQAEGTLGLARPFQAAGIPLIVATLWPVDSYPTKELMIAFHKHRKGNRLSTARALRQAQLDMIRSSFPEFRKPYHWAAYTLIGGHAKF